MTYPTKVQRVVERVGRSEWTLDAVEEKPSGHGSLWIVRCSTPGNVFVRQTLDVYVSTTEAYTIEGTDVRMRSAQRFMGGHVDRFGSHRDLKTWRDFEIAAYPRLDER